VKGERTGLTERSRRVIFTYLFSVYLVAAVSETLISPLFPLIRRDLGLSVAQQASLVAALTTTIGVFNLVGGALGYRSGDRRIVRAAALALAIGAAISGAAGSYFPLLLGQIVIGVGSGLFFGPGLASIGRMYSATRGRAVASYGLAYSVGLALASFSANAGEAMWRWMFWGTGALALVLAFVAPHLVEARESAAAPPLVGSLRSYLTHPLYRMSLVTGAVAGTMSYVVVGFTPTLFDDRGAALAIVTALVGIGRLVSAGGKYLSGWMFDRIGGPHAARAIMLAIAALGLGELVPPYRVGLIFIVPFVCATAMLFPISNALSVVALPERGSWGMGVYRAALVFASALVSGIVTVALRYFTLDAVMIATLLLPFAGAFWVGAAARRHGSRPAEAQATTEVVVP
jgi:DHA1 family quinolone resistance protein-like MFS transporter